MSTVIKPQWRGPGKSISKLTANEARFVEELLASQTFNVTEAARKAGYKNPASMGNKLLKKKLISAAIGKAVYIRSKKAGITADMVLKELACIGFIDPITMFDEEGTLLSIHDMPEGTRRAISSFEVESRTDEDGNTTTTAKIKLNSKIDSLELLAKHLGMLNDKLKIEGEGSMGVGFLAGLLSKVEQERNVIDVTSTPTIEHKGEP